MVEKGVIVYGNYMKIGLGATRNGIVYGRLEKVIPLSPPHRAMALPSTFPIQNKSTFAYN